MSAIQLGISKSEYDDMTPYELTLNARVYSKAKKQESEERLILTYLGASWQRAKKMPPIKTILQTQNEESTKKKMSEEEILNAIKSLNSSFGGDTY